MKLSIVIVNYNVEFFLEQCLNSVLIAIKGMDAEVFVVDNNSVDGSVELVRNRFPEVKLIANTDNVGFSRANNQAILESSGEYVLLLNPDTLVQEDTFRKVCDFMDQHPDAGGLGVKMIDGKGNFLPESKRGLPTPAVSFYKIFGLSSFFPRSRTFGKYHLGYLDKEKNHEIDVLSGAFMLLRKSVLDRIGLLDEAFFMYGEDIDLSYRITLAGYKNYYFAETEIIHYKGESTKKGSLNYVYVFYNAMVIFARKHFSNRNAGLFSFMINMAIWFRASLAVISRLLRVSWLPVLDILAMTGAMWLASGVYESVSAKLLDRGIITLAFPLYSTLWMLVLFFNSAYDRPFRYIKVLSSALYGLLIALVVYSLLPEEWRFSRIMIVSGSISSLLYLLISRLILKQLKVGFYGSDADLHKRFALVGGSDEQERLVQLVKASYRGEPEFVLLNTEELPKLNDLVRLKKINEIIFSGKDLTARQIITQMTQVESSSVDFKIAPPESEFIIGSNSIDSQGDYYLLEMAGIYSAANTRNKRLTDLLLSLIFLATSPLLILFQHNKKGFLSNLLFVLPGEYGWVGFNREYSQTLRTNNLKKGVIPVTEKGQPEQVIIKSNLIYAKDYAWYRDVLIAVKRLRELGNKPA
ncbi:MAG: glycosyltransferase [Bacteroidota bacterium]